MTFPRDSRSVGRPPARGVIWPWSCALSAYRCMPVLICKRRQLRTKGVFGLVSSPAHRPITAPKTLQCIRRTRDRAGHGSVRRMMTKASSSRGLIFCLETFFQSRSPRRPAPCFLFANKRLSLSLSLSVLAL